jgi:hypothetical protein
MRDLGIKDIVSAARSSKASEQTLSPLDFWLELVMIAELTPQGQLLTICFAMKLPRLTCLTSHLS